jgi:hypothetical protein
MSNETKTRERGFIILLPGFCYYCLGSSFLTCHDYTNIQLRYSSAIAPYTSRFHSREIGTFVMITAQHLLPPKLPYQAETSSFALNRLYDKV